MLHAHELIFDDTVYSATSTHSLAAYNERMGRWEALTISVVPSVVTGGTGTLVVALETSADSASWIQVGSTEIINATLTPGTPVIGGFAPSSDVVGVSAYVRCRMTLSGATSAALRVWCTGRGRRVTLER